MKAYMKSALAFVGADLRAIDVAARRLSGEVDDAEPAELRRLAEALLHHGTFEVRIAGTKLLRRLATPSRKRPGRLGPVDLPWLVALVRHAAAWALVDELAQHVLASIVAAHPDPAPVLRKWARDESLWVRRAALLSLEPELRRGRGDFALFEELAVPMLGEREFFIRKAIGWVLRSTSRTRPDLVRGFVRRHGGAMSGLTRREASKYL
jgi:3-methyladenine DNA glycosylase AlkD